ncbi:MAG: hypothetical protein M1821_004412 [Bathelium mastoideum]|nr:MAG: hypothetical protein M1821_004412 [Bathelium mastoideum]
MASPSGGAIYSQGGAVFIGNGNAGHDIININHITTVKPLALSLHQSFFASSQRFADIQKEIASLLGVLESITGNSARIRIDCNEEPEICSLSRDCHKTLKDLEALKHRYEALPAQTQLTWERCEWDMEELRDTRARLIGTVTSLNMVYSRLIHSSTTVIMQKLETFIDKAGKRKSIVTNRTTGSLSADDKEAWRQLRKELESVGITPALFSQHRELIIERLLKAIEDGDLVECSEEDLPEDTGDLVEYSEEELPEDTGEQLSGTSQRSIENHLTTAIPAFRLTPIIDIENTKTSTTSSSAPRLVQRRRWIPTSLFRRAHDNASLLAAVEQGDADLVQYLLQKGAKADLANDNGTTPLLLAAKLGHEAIVRKLLETGEVTINSGFANIYSPLLVAAEKGHKAIVKQLFQTGKVNLDPRGLGDYKLLHIAAQDGLEDVVKQLLETGIVDINHQGSDGCTLLYTAAKFGHAAVIKQLLEIDEIDINLPHKWEGTPLHVATRKGHEAVVQRLLERSEININAADGRGDTPLHVAARKGHEAVVQRLLERSEIDVNLLDRNGETPLHIAAALDHTAVIEQLCGTGKVNVNDRNIYKNLLGHETERNGRGPRGPSHPIRRDGSSVEWEHLMAEWDWNILIK